MHELSLLADLLRKVEAVARREQASTVTRVSLRVGALCHLSAEHLREHFMRAALGTVAEHACLDIEVMTEITDLHAQEIMIDSVEVLGMDDNESTD